MRNQLFALTPFESLQSLSNLTLTGHLARQGPTLNIRYTLLGPLDEIVIPGFMDRPERLDGLWQSTCFELFIGIKGAQPYWEFNLSPAGHWNIYAFTTYRQNMRWEPTYPSLPFHIQHRPNSLQLDLAFKLTQIIPVDQALNIGISAVIQLRDGALTYWALTHPGPQPDFHQREGWIAAALP